MAKGDPSSLYVPEDFSGDVQDNASVVAWLRRQHQNISLAMELRNITEFLNVPPTKPREGLLVGADGVNWNPGGGKGLYGFFAGAWHLMFTDISVGVIGTTNLADNAVTNPKVADNAIGNNELAAGAVTANKFASGVGPIEIFSSLPGTGNFEGRIVYLTTDDKLYRYDGAAFIKTTDGADLVANSVTATKISVAQLSAISADLGEVTAGSIRGVNVNASSHTTKGSYLSSALSGGEGTVNVKNTADFPSSGTAHVIDTTNDRDDFTYSGKTATTLTGCSGVLAHNSGATIIPKGVKCMVIDGPTNEMRFYGDRGDGTVEELGTIGIKDTGSIFTAVFGSLNLSGRSGLEVFGGGANAILAVSTSGIGVEARSSGSAQGLAATSVSGYGGQIDGNATKGNLLLQDCNASTFPTNKTSRQLAQVGGRLFWSDGSHFYPLTMPYFESTEQAIPGASTTTTVAHGLTDGAGTGIVPRNFGVWLRCKTAEQGYAVGDEIQVMWNQAAPAHIVFADATNIGISVGAGQPFNLVVRSGGFGGFTITAGNWKLVFRAW